MYLVVYFLGELLLHMFSVLKASPRRQGAIGNLGVCFALADCVWRPPCSEGVVQASIGVAWASNWMRRAPYVRPQAGKSGGEREKTERREIEREIEAGRQQSLQSTQFGRETERADLWIGREEKRAAPGADRPPAPRPRRTSRGWGGPGPLRAPGVRVRPPRAAARLAPCRGAGPGGRDRGALPRPLPLLHPRRRRPPLPPRRRRRAQGLPLGVPLRAPVLGGPARSSPSSPRARSRGTSPPPSPPPAAATAAPLICGERRPPGFLCCSPSPRRRPRRQPSPMAR